MSEQDPTPVTPDPAADPSAQGDPAADKPLGPNGEKALAAERAARASAEKAASALQAKLDEIEKANLTDLERAQQDAKEAREALSKATRDGLAATVALEKGVKPSLVKFLSGSTQEELAASADELIAELGVAPTTPRPDLTQSATRDPAASAGPEADFARFLKSQMG